MLQVFLFEIKKLATYCVVEKSYKIVRSGLKATFHSTIFDIPIDATGA